VLDVVKLRLVAAHDGRRQLVCETRLNTNNHSCTRGTDLSLCVWLYHLDDAARSQGTLPTPIAEMAPSMPHKRMSSDRIADPAWTMR